nr:MAG TPA: hypothetical protein [Caudoviricetes sp.]
MLDSLEKAFWELRGYTGRTVQSFFREIVFHGSMV